MIYELCPASRRHLFVFIRSGFHTVFVLNGKETFSISVQSHLQVHRWCIVHKQPRIRTLSGPDVSCWTWDQGHHREHHFCFLPRFTTVDWEGWSTSHFDLRQTRWFQFPHHKLSVPESSPAYGDFISQLKRYARACSSYEYFFLRARWLSSKLLKQGYLAERLKSSFRKFYGRYGDLIQQYEVSLSRMLNDILILDQVTSQPIRLSTNFMTLIPSLTFTDYEWFPWSICNGCGMPAGNAYPSGHLVPSLVVGLACASIVETRFLELAMSLLDFSPRISLGTFSILLMSVLLVKEKGQ